MLTREQMARRAAGEINEGQRVFFGPGVPQAVQAVAPPTESSAPFDLALVEALEVAADGTLTLASGTVVPEAKRVIGVMPHVLADGAPRIRAQHGETGPKAQRLITDRAVIDVTPQGLVLCELAKNYSAAEIQAHTGAPLLADATLSVIAV